MVCISGCSLNADTSKLFVRWLRHSLFTGCATMSLHFINVGSGFTNAKACAVDMATVGFTINKYIPCRCAHSAFIGSNISPIPVANAGVAVTKKAQSAPNRTAYWCNVAELRFN